MTAGHRALLCLTVGRGASFTVPESMAQGEVCCVSQRGTGLCCVSQWGVVRALLCLRVWHRARFAVSDSEV